MSGWVSAAIAVAGAAYGAIEQSNAARKQEHANEEAQRQTAENAVQQKEQVTGNAQSQREEIARQMAATTAEQNVAAAISGTQLSPGTSLATIKNESQDAYSKALTGLDYNLQETQSNLDRGLQQNLSRLQAEKDMIVSDAQIFTAAGLSATSSVLNAKSKMDESKERKSLLEKQYGNTSTTAVIPKSSGVWGDK